jgi:hypothetical protein
MTIGDQFSKEQIEALKARTRKTQEPATVLDRLTRPVEGAVKVDAEALRRFGGVVEGQPQGRGWFQARAQERVK